MSVPAHGATARGPGTLMYSPRMAVTTPSRDDRSLDRYMAAIEQAGRDRGPLTRQGLADVAGARHWGPGQFRTALREAVGEGRVRETGRGQFGPPED